jgi:hypothetical protein
MVKTYRHKKTRSKKMRSKKMYRRRRKGGAPTPEQLRRAAEGLKRKSRPSSLKIGNTPSPTDRMTYVYNPETPSHIKILAEQRKQQIINKPLAEKNQFYILEIFQLPEHLPKHMDREIQYFFILGDEAREIFTFGPDDVKLQPTGFAYINDEFKKLL